MPVPNVPTIAEQGVKNFESGTCQGAAVPATLPKACADKPSATLIQVIRSPEIQARLIELGAEAMTSSPQETTEFLARENKRWADLIRRAANIPVSRSKSRWTGGLTVGRVAV